MIFCAKNEDGIPTWKLVLEGKKTVTRRLKPMLVGKEFAIQPGRGKRAVARGKVTLCCNSKAYKANAILLMRYTNIDYLVATIQAFLEEEARKEGFKSYEGLLVWFVNHKININNTYRIEFEVIEKYEDSNVS